MRKLSEAKTQNISKYTDNFFASNAFVQNGLKCYYIKSSAFEGNNFINVSKAVIAEKSPSKSRQKKSLHRRSFSEDRKKQESSTLKLQIDSNRTFRQDKFL